MRNEYSTLDIVKALEIPRERLRDWMNKGFIKPTIPAEGQGTRAVFTRSDVYAVALFQNLIEVGFKRSQASDFIYKLEKIGGTERTNLIMCPIVRVGEEPMRHVVPDYRVPKFKAVQRIKGVPQTKRDPKRSGFKWESEDIKVLGQGLHFVNSIKYLELAFFNSDGVPEYGGEEWEHLHIINFKGIRKKVDFALSSLD